MPPSIGFILLTHTKPEQIRRLIRRLNIVFEQPRIVCHNDFDRCGLPLEEFPGNVSFVQPHFQTGWGVFPVVEAVVRAIQVMYAAPENPDWFVLLSGSDYPIKPAAKIRHELAASRYDAYINYKLIDTNVENEWGLQFEHEWKEWQRECYKRYFTKRWCYPSVTRRLRPTRRMLSLKHPIVTWPFLPFTTQFRCYAGETWFTANRLAAQYIVRFHSSRPALAYHYRTAPVPEESYFQCILANEPGLTLKDNDYRYTDWSRGGPHPKTLGIEDLPQLRTSTDHFARKFDIDYDTSVLNELDIITSA